MNTLPEATSTMNKAERDRRDKMIQVQYYGGDAGPLVARDVIRVTFKGCRLHDGERPELTVP